MSTTFLKKTISMARLFQVGTILAALFFAVSARAAAPGIKGSTFALTAQASYITQPDGQSIYSWGYGCTSGSAPTFAPAIQGATCPTMQIPGPTLIVNEGDTVHVTLTNNLPNAAGNTSILFPGFTVTATAVDATATGPKQGLLTTEAPVGGSVTYTFVATSPGTRSYYSGTQGDLQIEMGMYGAVIVLPNSPPNNCSTLNASAQGVWHESDFRLATAAYDNVTASCYDREYLFQFSEIDPKIHKQAEAAALTSTCLPGACPTSTFRLSPITRPISW